MEPLEHTLLTPCSYHRNLVTLPQGSQDYRWTHSQPLLQPCQMWVSGSVSPAQWLKILVRGGISIFPRTLGADGKGRRRPFPSFVASVTASRCCCDLLVYKRDVSRLHVEQISPSSRERWQVSGRSKGPYSLAFRERGGGGNTEPHTSRFP